MAEIERQTSVRVDPEVLSPRPLWMRTVALVTAAAFVLQGCGSGIQSDAADPARTSDAGRTEVLFVSADGTRYMTPGEKIAPEQLSQETREFMRELEARQTELSEKSAFADVTALGKVPEVAGVFDRMGAEVDMGGGVHVTLNAERLPIPGLKSAAGDGGACMLSVTTRFDDAAAYEFAKADARASNWSVSNMMEAKSAYFGASPASPGGVVGFNDASRTFVTAISLNGVAACDNATIKSAVALMTSAQDEKAVAEKLTGWERWAILSAVWITVRWGFPGVLVAAGAPFPVANAVGACFATGITAAMAANWAGQAWFSSVGIGLASCLVAGAGTWWAKWAAESISWTIRSALSRLVAAGNSVWSHVWWIFPAMQGQLGWMLRW